MTQRPTKRRRFAVLAVPLFVAACASSNPGDTVFDWNLQTDPGASASRDRPPDSERYSEGTREQRRPAWYDDRSTRDAVTVASLPAPGSEATSVPARMNAPREDASLAPGSAPAFSWPLRGRILSAFGAGDGGQRNDGINIAAVYGTPIRAAAAGTVSYAGDELKGYGNLVLIRHAEGYITAYAHAESFTVNKGDVVKQGQVIGYAGDSGDVAEPQLHFEIRRNTTPLDPRPLLDSASYQG